MNDYFSLSNKFTEQGYKNLGCANVNSAACEAMQKTTNAKWFKIDRCEHLVVCHDLRVFFTVDSGD